MKLKLIAISASLFFVTSLASAAEPSLCLKISRYLGYGIHDGYHAQRNCLPMGEGCDSCSAVQQPMMVMPGYSQGYPAPMQQIGYVMPVGTAMPYRVAPMPAPAMMNPSLPAQSNWKSAAMPGYRVVQQPTATVPTRGSLPRW